jgi:carboxymethylenebutenolidase
MTMGEWTKLRASDGHELAAYTALPAAPKAGIVVLQEIFGVTGHIRAIADDFAADGYATIAPALFDRSRSGIELAYTDIAAGREIVTAIPPGDTMQDVAAAVDWANAFGKVATVGYCWGGTLAFLAATSLPVVGAVAYYGGMIAKLLDRVPKVPVMYHFGGLDPYITADDVAAIRAALAPEELFVYDDAGHGFNCSERADFSPHNATRARERTREFLQRVTG